jgi:thiamine transporter ThiT
LRLPREDLHRGLRPRDIAAQRTTWGRRVAVSLILAALVCISFSPGVAAGILLGLLLFVLLAAHVLAFRQSAPKRG